MKHTHGVIVITYRNSSSALVLPGESFIPVCTMNWEPKWLNRLRQYIPREPCFRQRIWYNPWCVSGRKSLPWASQLNYPETEHQRGVHASWVGLKIHSEFWNSLWDKFNCTGGYEQRIRFGTVVFLVVMLASYHRSDMQKFFPAVCNNTKRFLGY